MVRPLRCCSWLWGSGCPDLTIGGLRYTLPGASDVLVYCVWRVALPHLPLGVQSQARRHPIAVAMWTYVSGEGRCRLCGRSFKWGYLQPLAVGTCLSYQGDLGWHIQRTTSIHSFWWRRSVRLGVARIFFQLPGYLKGHGRWLVFTACRLCPFWESPHQSTPSASHWA